MVTDENKKKKQLVDELKTLRSRLAEIERLKTTEEQSQTALQKMTHDPEERVKELNCLYAISNLREQPGISLEEMLQGIVDLVPSAWLRPEITCARVTVKDRVYKTGKFEETS